MPPVVAVAVAAGTGLLTALTIAGGATSALDVTVGAVSCLLSPVMLWRPVGSALGLSVLAVLSPAATPAATCATVEVARARRLPVAIGAAVAGAAAHLLQGAWRPSEGISRGWWSLLVVLAYGALVGWGAVARARRAALASLRERARRAEAEQERRVTEARVAERARIAREMHDVLAHRLSLVATYAGALEYRPDAPPEQLSKAAGVVRAGVHQALEELREVILLLRDDGTEQDGPPQPVLADLDRLIAEARDAGGRIDLHEALQEPGSLPQAAGRTAYRVVQEALTNARKHASGRPVTVGLTGGPGDGLRIEIGNPLPAEPLPAPPGSGTGLIGLGERVRLAGGRLEHGREAGRFTLTAWLPWPA
ncbi:histidine kinase [Actinocorallia longicatena]|uniref:histidine kinase n=1 Tax=Actinocorallia longicatena TaxID=111803 RepID=A0ABP6QJK4_9ACTN